MRGCSGRNMAVLVDLSPACGVVTSLGKRTRSDFQKPMARVYIQATAAWK